MFPRQSNSKSGLESIHQIVSGMLHGLPPEDAEVRRSVLIDAVMPTVPRRSLFGAMVSILPQDQQDLLRANPDNAPTMLKNFVGKMSPAEKRAFTHKAAVALVS